MDLPQIPNMVDVMTLSEASVVKVENVSPTECEQLFDIPGQLLSPKLESAPLNTFPSFSGPCKLEADTHELGATFSDDEEVEGTLTREIGTSNSELALDHQLPLGISQSFSASPSDSQEKDSRNEEIMSSTLSTSDGTIQPELLGPKLIVSVKRLREKSIEELTAGIWRCDSCGKTEKSFLMLNLHFDTGCEKLSPIECDVCPAVFRDYSEFVPHFMEHQMEETRRCPICLCECTGDIKQHLIIKRHYSPNLSELDLQGNALLVVSQNPSTNGTSNSHDTESEDKSLENREIFSNSHLYSKNHGKLERYLKTNTEKKLNKRYVGKKRFSHSINLIGHKRVDTDEKPFKCDVCNKGFSHSSSLNMHQRLHTGEKPFKCDVCNKGFSQSGNLNMHQRSHTGEKPFKCDVCNKGFSQSSHLNVHQRTHTGEKPFKCDVCNKDFSRLGDLNKHHRVHTGEKPFKCDVCNKGFSQSIHLNMHQRLHTGEKPFKCDVCNKSFSYSSSLVGHQRLHTGEKPFKCDICNKCFSVNGTLIAHQRTHTGEKPFNCDVCNKGFSKSSYLNVHQRLHTGEKPFKCDICHKCFSLKGNLITHQRTHR
ncbi:zinc finger protein ZFP2-like [Artemia franciscana]